MGSGTVGISLIASANAAYVRGISVIIARHIISQARDHAKLLTLCQRIDKILE